MIPYSKFVHIYQELVNCLEVVEKQLNKVLDYGDEHEVLVDFGVDDEKEFTVVYFDYREGCNLKSVVDESSYVKMLEINLRNELLSFLGERLIS